MESISAQKLLLFFVRHGERADQVQTLTAKEKAMDQPRSDPSLTDAGKLLA